MSDDATKGTTARPFAVRWWTGYGCSGGATASRKAAGYHPLVWALWVDLDALWRAVGPYADPRARLLEGVARWVRLTGKGQVPGSEWWLASLRLLLATLAVVDVPAVEQPRIARWVEAAKAAGPIRLGRDLGPLDA